MFVFISSSKYLSKVTEKLKMPEYLLHSNNCLKSPPPQALCKSWKKGAYLLA